MIPAQSSGVSEASAGLSSCCGIGAFVSAFQVKEKLFFPLSMTESRDLCYGKPGWSTQGESDAAVSSLLSIKTKSAGSSLGWTHRKVSCQVVCRHLGCCRMCVSVCECRRVLGRHELHPRLYHHTCAAKGMESWCWSQMKGAVDAHTTVCWMEFGGGLISPSWLNADLVRFAGSTQ